MQLGLPHLSVNLMTVSKHQEQLETRTINDYVTEVDFELLAVCQIVGPWGHPLLFYTANIANQIVNHV